MVKSYCYGNLENKKLKTCKKMEKHKNVKKTKMDFRHRL